MSKPVGNVLWMTEKEILYPPEHTGLGYIYTETEMYLSLPSNQWVFFNIVVGAW